jgi:phospholipid/cholesterol/gamma-HCH transport system substrate-binding protein
MDERRWEVALGAVVLVGGAALIALFWMLGELRFGRGTDLVVQFSHTGNVVRGAPVKLGGVKVGRVEVIRLHPERRDQAGEPLPVDMELSLNASTRGTVRTDAQLTVATLGPLGEAYLELAIGSADAPRLAAGQPLRGVDPARLDLLFARMSKMLEAVAQIIEDPPDALGELIASTGALTRTVDGVLKDSRGELKTLTAELAAAAVDLRQLARIARQGFEPGGRGDKVVADLPQLTRDARTTFAGLAGTAGKLTEEDGERLRHALAAYASAGERLERLAARGEQLLAKIEAGEGTIGGLHKDPQLYKDLRDLLEDLKKHPWKLLWKK